MDKTVLKKQLEAGYMENNVFHNTEAGTTQGGVSSPPTLANMVLDGTENYLREHLGGRMLKHKIHVIRYADDFIVSANSKRVTRKWN